VYENVIGASHTPQVASNVVTILIKQGKIRKKDYYYFEVN
jgi:hypothetical protein